MVVEQLPDELRQLVLVLATQAYVSIKDDPDMNLHTAECQTIIRMLSGTDTRVSVERAYPSTPPADKAGNQAPHR
jgi:hypothetical protein